MTFSIRKYQSVTPLQTNAIKQYYLPAGKCPQGDFLILFFDNKGTISPNVKYTVSRSAYTFGRIVGLIFNRL